MFETVHYLSLRSSDRSQCAGFAFGVHGDGQITVFTLSRAVPRSDDEVSSVTMDVEDAREVYIECLRQGAEKTSLAATVGSSSGFGRSGVGLATKEHAEAWKERWYRNFHPAGYGSRVRFEERDDGMVLFRYSRANSCD